VDLSNRILPTRLLREGRHGLVGELEIASAQNARASQ
jgi:hypothetical protein